MVGTEQVDSLPTTAVIYFDAASAEVPTDRKPFLEGLASALKNHPKIKLKITGHSCVQGDQAVNKQISNERAKAVAKILIENGVSEGQLKVIGVGIRKPVTSSRTKAGRQKNRRVEFEWIKM
jgi:OOP family OmpA-OmpF porin